MSGLAYGCDTAAHQGALEAGGATTAILANGLDDSSIYPSANCRLARKILEHHGLLLSEYPIRERINHYRMVARGRIQTGLGQATVLVQTWYQGGSLYASESTLKLGKPLFVVDFKPHSPEAGNFVTAGNRMMIEEGGIPLRSNEVDLAVERIETGNGKQPINLLR